MSKLPPRAILRWLAGWLSWTDALPRGRYQELTADLGGAENLSYPQRSLCERALWLEYWLAQQERELAAGGEFDVGRWTQAANSLQGIFGKLGLQRVARDVPSLNEFLAQREAKQ